MTEAGWSRGEADDALGAFADIVFTPPVPKPTPRLTARDAFNYAVLFTALAVTAVYLVFILHAILTIQLPDAADSKYTLQSAVGSIHWAIAALIISTPVYVWLSLRTDRLAAEDQGFRRSLVRSWLTYVALFIAGLLFLGDGIYVIYKFLAGEITIRFLLKAGIVAAVSGSIFVHYLRNQAKDDEH